MMKFMQVSDQVRECKQREYDDSPPSMMQKCAYIEALHGTIFIHVFEATKSFC